MHRGNELASYNGFDSYLFEFLFMVFIISKQRTMSDGQVTADQKSGALTTQITGD